jgi:hypothetical protein
MQNSTLGPYLAAICDAARRSGRASWEPKDAQRVQLVLFGMQNRAFCPYLAAICGAARCSGRASKEPKDAQRVQLVRCAERFPQLAALLDVDSVYFKQEDRIVPTDKMCSYRYL